MEQGNSDEVSQDQLRQIEGKLKLENTAKGGANWFYWIAGLSIINSVTSFAGIEFFFVIGLGITQAISGSAMGIASEVESSFGSVVQIVALFLNVVIATGFIGIGYFARKGRTRIYVIGMALYAADALLLILFADVLGFVFHLVALFFLYVGLRAIRTQQSVDAGDTNIDTAMQIWPYQTRDREFRRNLGRFALILIIPLIICAIFWWVLLSL